MYVNKLKRYLFVTGGLLPRQQANYVTKIQ